MTVSAVSSSVAYTPLASYKPSENCFRVDVTKLVRLNDKLGPPIPTSPADLKRMQEALIGRFTVPVGPSDDAPSELYAEIKVGNKIVGRVYNSGCSVTPNEVAGFVHFGGPDEGSLRGPVLAQLRAEKIAKAMGGTIVNSDIAVTQAEFDARPPRQFYIDYEAMYAEMERDRQSAADRHQRYLATLASSAQSGQTDRAV